MKLDSDVRSRIEEFVRPLYVELDGVDTFDRVSRITERIATLRGDDRLDEEQLELLVLFHGVIPRLGSLRRNGRLDLFLRGLPLSDAASRRLRISLGRLQMKPETLEEKMIHDGILLEESGVVAAARRLMEAGRRRVSLPKALSALEPGPPPERFKTPRGAELGAVKRQEARDWIDALRAQLEIR